MSRALLAAVRAAVLASVLLTVLQADPPASLFGEARLLRQFPDVSFVAMDATSGEILSSRWDDLHQPAPVGSLIKPFTALAYAETHRRRYPAFRCGGLADGCWDPRGHGETNIEAALANSCNAYFLRLAERVEAESLRLVSLRFGLTAPPRRTPKSAYIGLGASWRHSPAEIMHAYRELTSRRGEPAVDELLEGLALAARQGTAYGVGLGLGGEPAWAKTGTSPCVHRPASGGDGYVIALSPAPNPRLVLLVRRHGVSGRIASQTAGRMMRMMQMMHMKRVLAAGL